MSDDFFDPNAPAKPEEVSNSSHRLETKFDDPPHLYSLTNEEPVKTVTQEASEAIEELLLGSSPVQPSTDSKLHTETSSIMLAGPENGEAEVMGAKLRLYEELSDLILCEYSFDTLVEKGLQALMRALDAQAGSIFEFDSERGDFFFRASRGGASDKVRNFRVPSKQGIVGFVSESRNALLINDMHDDKLQLKSISVAVGFEARSCLAAPIMIVGKLYGVVEVFNKMGVLYFQERDKAFLVEGANFFAKALEVRFFTAELVKRAG